mmetsp:Transcript_105216/g.202072  ORF Transcript_105216/g.202072 Transcript_105216/m.202072 type:complete len:397 (+) Transcript_105216:3-1193(+)
MTDLAATPETNAGQCHSWESRARSMTGDITDLSMISTAASESEVGDSFMYGNMSTVSGASGKALAQELAKWLNVRRSGLDGNALESMDEFGPRNLLETVDLKVATYYDRPFGKIFNAIYDSLQLSSGRDKFCALMQGYAKFMSATVEFESERYFMFRAIEDSLSDTRKIFRLFKEFREVYKVRRGFFRMREGIVGHGAPSIPATCGLTDILGHCCSFWYYLFDNLLWAASVGLLRTKEIPRYQRSMWKGLRRNGYVVSKFGGVTNIKFRKNQASIVRLQFATIANTLLLWKAVGDCRQVRGGAFQGWDDPRLFHTLELVSIACNFRILLSKLKFVKLKSHATLGLLAMVAALCGIWVNWRKVRKKKFGTKEFESIVAQRRRKGQSESDLSKMGIKS